MNDMILILNYSDVFSAEIARRLRAEQVYARIVCGATTAAQIRGMNPRGIILSGEAAGGQGVLDAGILDLGIPVLALGHAAHLLLAVLGGASADTAISERKAMIEYSESMLFAGVSSGERYLAQAQTLMLPPDVTETARAGGCAIAFENPQKRQYGVQFELERNDPEGSAILKNFARDICGCSAWWSLDAAMSEAEQTLAEQAHKGGRAICAVSGGVDSAVAAMLTHRAFGERMTAVFVDTGLMREGEADGVQAAFEAMQIPLLRVDRSEAVLAGLAHKRGMEEKRRVVVDILSGEMLRQSAAISGGKTLVFGTNYSDYLHSSTGAPRLTEDGMTIVEPLMDLFKDEVRAMAVRLNMDAALAARKPFPALGLGARILGEVTRERLLALRTAEAVFREEICAAGLERKLYKYFPVLAGDETASGREMMILRAVTVSGGQLVPARLPYDLVERTVQSILEKTPSISRVFYDQTPTPVGHESFV